MVWRLFGVAVLGTALCAQTAVEQLQKGIYAQETAGDLDGAIAIYRQILQSGQPQRIVAATAQFRLAQALVQKGDMEGAATEFQKLVTGFPEYRDLTSALGRKLAGITLARRARLGTATDYQHYRHKATGAELTAPFGTSFLGDTDSSDGGDMAVFGGHQYAVSVWMKAEEHPASELFSLLEHDLAVKPTMRDGFDGWKARPDVQSGPIGNGRYLSAVADYTENGRKMVEILTWYRTPKTHLLFFSRVAAEAELDVRRNMATMVSAAMIP